MTEQMIIPPYLKPNDTIGIVSTASKIDKNVVKPAIELLKNLGYHVLIAEHVFSEHNQFAGTDSERSSDFQKMIDNQTVKAIICSRGGYGSIRTIQDIDWRLFLKNPKWIVGFSDVTTIHSKLNRIQIASIHGVMTKFFVENNTTTTSFETLHKTLTGQQQSYSVKPSKYNKTGIAIAQLVGGNLSILYSLRGTQYDIDTNGKILFIEDLSEYLYHLDRIMMNFKTGGVLTNLKGLIVGSFTGMKDTDTPFGKTVEEIILDTVSEYDFPVIFNFPAGHQPQNYALKMGCEIEIQCSENKVIVKQ